MCGTHPPRFTIILLAHEGLNGTMAAMAGWFSRWRRSNDAPHVFLSYRREDSAEVAGRLFDVLAARWGADHVFLDIANIELGMDWERHVRAAIDSSDAVLALIGSRWLAASRRDSGTRRLDEPEDFVRLQIESALRQHKRLLPVLVDGALMPKAALLPVEIRRLTEFQAMPLRSASWNDDCAALIRTLGPGRP